MTPIRTNRGLGPLRPLAMRVELDIPPPCEIPDATPEEEATPRFKQAVIRVRLATEKLERKIAKWFRDRR